VRRAVWIAILLTISFLGFLALSNVVILVKASGNVVFVSHTGYVDSEGNYRVVGEVENVGSQAVDFVQVTATFLDSNSAVIDTRFDLTMLNVILVGRKSPFEIDLLNVAESARVHNYTLSVTFQTTDTLPLGLRIPTYNSTIDAQGRLHVTGQIENIGNEKAINTRAVATFYDSEGKVVAASSSFLDPELLGDLNPNVTQPFEIVLSQDRTTYVNTYVLTAECNQYEALPARARILGDLNDDGKVNLQDLVIFAKAYGSKPSDTNWNPNADLDSNGVVGLTDLVILATHYGQHAGSAIYSGAPISQVIDVSGNLYRMKNGTTSQIDSQRARVVPKIMLGPARRARAPSKRVHANSRLAARAKHWTDT
jgi:hypothetical protein